MKKWLALGEIVVFGASWAPPPPSLFPCCMCLRVEIKRKVKKQTKPPSSVTCNYGLNNAVLVRLRQVWAKLFDLGPMLLGCWVQCYWAVGSNATGLLGPMLLGCWVQCYWAVGSNATGLLGPMLLDCHCECGFGLNYFWSCQMVINNTACVIGSLTLVLFTAKHTLCGTSGLVSGV